MKQPIYISVDGEFSGLDYTKHELISIGFCNCYDESDIFYVEIKPSKPMDPAATGIHGLSWNYLQKNGLEPNVAAKKIHEWLSNKKTDMLVFVGYPVTLDFIFLDQLFKQFKLENPFHYEPMEVHALAVALLGLEPGFKHDELRDQLFLAPATNKHNALADAQHQAEEYVALMELAKKLRNVEVSE